LRKDKEMRELAKSLYLYDYLDEKEIDSVMRGFPLDKEKIREHDSNKTHFYF
jgi:hypothetical protein